MHLEQLGLGIMPRPSCSMVSQKTGRNFELKIEFFYRKWFNF